MSWQDGLTVPMPKIYVPDEDFVGEKVTLHMCEYHEDCNPAPGFPRKDVSLTGNCNCGLKGKTVTITGMKQTERTRFYRSTCYTVAESSHLVHESEFSEEGKKEKGSARVTKGYILEGQPGFFLAASFTYVPGDSPLEGYLHNTGVLKSVLKVDARLSSPITKAYPGEYNWETSKKRITGEAISLAELRKKILVR